MISVIVPIYNVEDYLPRCLDSIINQSFGDLDIILIDDGSTDSSGKICEDYKTKDQRVTVIHKENGGQYSARNMGLQQAKGDFVFMLDGDDAVHPQIIEILHEMLLSGDYDLAMCYGEKINDVSLIPEKSREIIEDVPTKELTQDMLMQSLYSKGEGKLQFAVVWNKLYKRSVLENLSFVNTYSEDTEFNNRVFLNVKKAIVTSQSLYYYIQRDNSALHQGVSLRYVKIPESLHLCLNAIPEDKGLYRSFCLRQIYRRMPSIRYWSKGSPLYQTALDCRKKVIYGTIKEFVASPYISIMHKIVLLFFNYCPFIYMCFVKVMELKARIKGYLKRIYMV